MNRQNKLLTIGQFAAMHGINKKTLMWYDEIGLFWPAAVNPENGYRCYSYRQSAVLETILLLRELDVSVSEIQDFMKNRSAASLERLLKEKTAELEQTMEHLRAVRKTLDNHRRNMTTLLTMDLSEISIVEKEESCLVTVDIDPGTSFEKQVEMITAETKKYQLHRLHDASYGSMISVEKLCQGDFDGYSSLFIEIPFPIKRDGLHIQPQGRYVRGFHKGRWENLPSRYQEIFAFARRQGVELTGFSYEMGINENVVDRVEDYIVQIEIPVKD